MVSNRFGNSTTVFSYSTHAERRWESLRDLHRFIDQEHLPWISHTSLRQSLHERPDGRIERQCRPGTLHEPLQRVALPRLSRQTEQVAKSADRRILVGVCRPLQQARAGLGADFLDDPRDAADPSCLVEAAQESSIVSSTPATVAKPPSLFIWSTNDS